AGAYGTVEDITEGREPAGRLAKLRAEGAGVLALLSEGRGWALRAALRARRVIRRVRPHVIVSSSPPVAAHLAAWLATRGLEIPCAGVGIAHVGALYGGRSLSLVLRALRLFLERHPEAAADGTRLRSAGYADAARTAALQHEITALQLERHVELLGVISRAAA